MPTFDTPEAISVDVEVGVGDILIEATDRHETVVEVRPSDPARRADVAAAEQTRVEYANGHLLIKAPSRWRQLMSRRGESVDVVIALPTGSRVLAEAGVAAVHGRGRMGEWRCKVGAGDIQLDEVGPADLKTGAGDIVVEQVVGRTDIVTGTGAVRVGRADGTVAVKNSNGDTSIGEVTGDAAIRAANGSIAVDHALAGIVAKTANGKIRIGDVARGAVVTKSAAGDIEVGIRDGVAAWLDLNTKFGRVHSDLGSAETPGAGEDTVELHATTSYGDITVHRSFVTQSGGVAPDGR